MALSISYLSHGLGKTGGYFHEKFFVKILISELAQKNVQVKITNHRTNRLYSGLSKLKMIWFGFKNAQANVVVTTNWLALYAIIRNLLSKNKIFVIWHHHSLLQTQSFSSKIYFGLLFNLINLLPKKKLSIIVVADYWKLFFRKKCKSTPIYLFPNLFETIEYTGYKLSTKKNIIYLGQYSSKNDSLIFELALRLNKMGYSCFFSTIDKAQAYKSESYEVICFSSKQQYLEAISEAKYSIAFVAINEGWNRVAHESILVGTQVIGTPKGGLKQLLRESNSLVAQNMDQIIEIINEHRTSNVPDYFIENYDVMKASEYMQPIIGFLLGNSAVRN